MMAALIYGSDNNIMPTRHHRYCPTFLFDQSQRSGISLLSHQMSAIIQLIDGIIDC